MKFTYRVRKEGESEVAGEREAPDRFALARALHAEGYFVLSIRGENESISPWRERFEQINASIQRITGRVRLDEKIFFATNLSAMISAGLPLSRALSALERQTHHEVFRAVLLDLSSKISTGTSLADALRSHPTIFPPVFVAVVSSGEASGRLADALQSLAVDMGKESSLKKKVRGALMYPMVVVSAMLLVAGLMLVYVVPSLSATFRDLNVPLPRTTQLVLAFSDALATNGFILLLGIVAVGGVFVLLVRTNRGRMVWDGAILSLPLVGGIARDVNIARTARTLASLIGSGVDVPASLLVAGQVVQNVRYRAIIAEAGVEVIKGKALSDIFSKYPKLYEPLFAEMLAVGEETGQLSGMAERIALFYETRVDQTTKDLSVIIEPVLMVFAGTAVGFFAVSMVQPIYSITDSL